MYHPSKGKELPPGPTAQGLGETPLSTWKWFGDIQNQIPN